MVLSSSCRCGAGVKTIRQSSNCSRVRNPAPLAFVSCYIFIYILFVLYLYLCFHFSVFLFFFNYTPMEVVLPVGMLVITGVLLMVLFLIHPRRTDVGFNVGC